MLVPGVHRTGAAVLIDSVAVRSPMSVETRTTRDGFAPGNEILQCLHNIVPFVLLVRLT